MRWYSYRWLIERHHFVLKSGCGLETLQLEKGRRIEMDLATYSIVDWRLLWLTYQARLQGEESCESHVFFLHELSLGGAKFEHSVQREKTQS